MKKLIILTLILCIPGLADAQVGRILRNVKSSIAQEVLSGSGDKEASEAAPEPPSASDDAELVIDIGKYKIDYTESTICVTDDGRVLLWDRITGNYFISNNGVTEGPFKEGDKRVGKFRIQCAEENGDDDPLSEKYAKYITKSGEKYLISFGGKSYGPYARIDKFVISGTGNKFVAFVVENILETDDDLKKMDEEMRNAKSDTERMQISLKYSRIVQEKLAAVGYGDGITPKMVSNDQITEDNVMTLMGGEFSGKIKYDDIVVVAYDKILDLQGHTLLTITPGTCNTDEMFVSSDNSKYACYRYGTLTFSDGNTLAELFNPHLVKKEGKLYLSYMYYSPKKNSIMQHKISF